MKELKEFTKKYDIPVSNSRDKEELIQKIQIYGNELGLRKKVFKDKNEKKNF